MILVRLGLGVGVLLVISVVIFGATELLPGDLAEEILGQAATPDSIAALRAELGLDRPAPVRYGRWLADIARGDFGVSLASRRPVAELVGQRLVNTLLLALYTAVMAVPLALAIGLLAALWRNSAFDRSVNAIALGAISLPEFFIAYLLIFVLAQSGVFPSMANLSVDASLGERLYRTFLPALTLTTVIFAHMMRMTRAAVINVLASAYVEMARLKGIRPWRVIVQHALPNALAPIVNVIALNLAYLVTGVVVVEVVFVYPGLGQLIVDAVSKRDLPVVQAVSLIFAAIYVLLNLLADVLAMLANPRAMHTR